MVMGAPLSAMSSIVPKEKCTTNRRKNQPSRFVNQLAHLNERPSSNHQQQAIQRFLKLPTEEATFCNSAMKFMNSLSCGNSHTKNEERVRKTMIPNTKNQHDCVTESNKYQTINRIDDRATSDESDASTSSENGDSMNGGSSKVGFVHTYRKPCMPTRSSYVAMDCEMVSTIGGLEVARVVLVDWKGRTVLDTFVKPTYPVTDYLTFISGIVEADLRDAPYFADIRNIVRDAIYGKILVGHGLENDLAALQLQHPWWLTRDTAYYQPFMQRRECNGESICVPRRLKDLCKEKLNKDIQHPGKAHCPAEDAQSALDLYKTHRPRWERCVTVTIRNQRRLARQQDQCAY